MPRAECGRRYALVVRSGDLRLLRLVWRRVHGDQDGLQAAEQLLREVVVHATVILQRFAELDLELLVRVVLQGGRLEMDPV